ncbi:MAG: hypothetical protein H0W98_00625 [Chloroflexi bacterium]|nr:hypothetical protein [Chloroflexota bacterium]
MSILQWDRARPDPCDYGDDEQETNGVARQRAEREGDTITSSTAYDAASIKSASGGRVAPEHEEECASGGARERERDLQDSDDHRERCLQG